MFAELTVTSLPLFLSLNAPDVMTYLNAPPSAPLYCEEVGDGNLNLVFLVRWEGKTVVVKQALPYVRCMGESNLCDAASMIHLFCVGPFTCMCVDAYKLVVYTYI
jgi:5-methylthioribose kinase